MTQELMPGVQAPLLPPEPPAALVGSLQLDALPPDQELIGPAPGADLVRSVQVLGVLDPITIREDGRGGYVVLDGRRRVKAARKAGLADIKVVQFDATATTGQVMGVASHATRRDNVASDLEAIESLLDAGYGLEGIARATGMPKGTVARRMALVGLVPVLRRALDCGQIGTGVAESAAKLGPKAQAALVDKLAESGKVTAADVKRVREARTQAKIDQLDWSAISGPDGDAPPADRRALALEVLTGEARMVLAGEPVLLSRTVQHGGGQWKVTVTVEPVPWGS